MKLILVAPDDSLYTAFQEYFAYFPNVEIVNSYFEQLTEFDCLVSPANSFGMMDGGMDAAIIKFFGLSLEKRVQQRILEDSMIIKGTDIPYTAMWAMLLTIRRHNQYSNHPINSVACPGLGTGIGQMPYREAARQMSVAYDHFIYPTKVINCFVAASKQLQIWEG